MSYNTYLSLFFKNNLLVIIGQGLMHHIVSHKIVVGHLYWFNSWNIFTLQRVTVLFYLLKLRWIKLLLLQFKCYFIKSIFVKVCEHCTQRDVTLLKWNYFCKYGQVSDPPIKDYNFFTYHYYVLVIFSVCQIKDDGISFI